MTGSTVAGSDPRRHTVREPGSGRFTRSTPPADPPAPDPAGHTAAAPRRKVRETPPAGAAGASPTMQVGNQGSATADSQPFAARLFREGLSALRRR